MSPSHPRLYWVCGGEIIMRGGSIGLAGAETDVWRGCRPISVERARELLAFYRSEGCGLHDVAARRHCLDCAAALEEAILAVAAWRRAARSPLGLAASNSYRYPVSP